MSKFVFTIREQMFQIEDLGESMNSQFLRLHESHFSGRGFDFTKFGSEALNFFEQNDGSYQAHDGFFNNFTIIWQYFLNQGRFKNAKHLWDLSLNIAYEWENKNQNKRIHKGTPYYFWGVTCILNGDFDNGFLLMHQALEEDKKTHKTDTPKTPAYYFVTLDYNELQQFFRPKVLEIAKFLSKILGMYRSQRNMSLSLNDLKSKFLEETNLQETIFSFVFSLFNLKKIFDIDKRLTQNVFSSLQDTNIIFNLCSIIENVIAYKNPNNGKLTLYHQLNYLSSQASLSLDGNKLSNINRDRDTDFSRTLSDLLQSQYQFNDGYSPSPIEIDLAVTYFFRNFGAHKIEHQPIIYENFEEITGRILNALFFSIEKLYI